MSGNAFDNKQVCFKGEVMRCVCDRDGFKIYAMNVDAVRYRGVKLNKYGNVSIAGDLPELSMGIEYEVRATPKQPKNPAYDTTYYVDVIRRNQPLTREGVRTFLEEVTSVDRAAVIADAYPNIIELVKEGRTHEIDTDRLKCIGEHSLAIIIDKITQNFHLSDIVAEFNGVLSFTMVKKLYDKYKSVDILKSALVDAPYTTLTAVNGIGFKKADDMVIVMQDEGILDFEYDIKTSQDRCHACIMYVLGENENEGNTKMDISKLLSAVKDLTPECIDTFSFAMNNNDIWFDTETKEVALSFTRDMEEYVATTVADNLDKWTDNKWKCDTEKYREVDGFKLSDEQMGLLDMVCNSSIGILRGFAGCGKTMSVKALISMLDDMDKSYVLMAPTGKAAKLLSEVTGREARTIHRAIGYNPMGAWEFNEENPLDVDVIIVDETSMVDVYLFWRLIQAIDFAATKLLLIGDDAQLPSVGCGNVFHDLMESNLIPTTTLTKVFRYGDGGVMKVATDIRMSTPYLPSSIRGGFGKFGNNADYVFYDISTDDKDERVAKYESRVVSIYKKLIESGCPLSDIQVINAKNVGEYGADKYNKLLQKVANKNCGSDNFFKSGDNMYYVGDIVMQCSNNYKAPTSEIVMSPVEIRFYRENKDVEWPTCFVANGESGKVVSVSKDFIDIDFGNGCVVQYNHGMAQDIKLGYAITTHKSQGSGFNNVILVTAKSDTFTLNSNLLYVGVTRSKKRCFHVGSVDTVNKVIKKKADMTRNTFMTDMLRKRWLENNDK